MQGNKHCCPPGSWPALITEYKPMGQTIEVGNTRVYHIGKGERVLLLISDIFGIESGRHRSVADTFAALGYNVYLPQFLCHPYDGPFEMKAIMQSIQNQDFGKIERRMASLIEYWQKEGIKRFACMGFCWGVWTAFKLASIYPQFVCIAGMHPSLGVEKLFGGDQINLAQSIKCPAFLYPADNDPANIKEGGQIVQLLKHKFGDHRTGTFTFSDMQHGWTVRGDLKLQKVYRDVKLAFEHAQKYYSSLYS